MHKALTGPLRQHYTGALGRLAAARAALTTLYQRACIHRKLAELEARLVEEETAARITAAVEAKVAEALASEAVQQSLQQRLEGERAQLEQQVGAGWGGGWGRGWGLQMADCTWRNRGPAAVGTRCGFQSPAPASFL